MEGEGTAADEGEGTATEGEGTATEGEGGAGPGENAESPTTGDGAAEDTVMGGSETV